ncbi:hypothetical protein [uncultured Ramlibacter sp.]|uniref:hypothetical protein n=1 Tax=uncultured Ramlibacter sp. TaxID=260755 RepID=UPI002637E59D|nr:hypothetical protein [uncultured Ramlibacter sp.]
MLSSKSIVYALCAAALVAGCGTTNTTVKAGVQDSAASLSIGFFKDFSESAFAVIERTGDGWRLQTLTQKRPVRESENQEIVAIDASGRRFEPAYVKTYSQFNEKGELIWFDCSELLVAISGKKQDAADYGGCGQSAFTRIDVISTVGKNAVAGVVTLGLAAGTKRQIDTDTMNRALQQSGAYEGLQNYLAELKLLSAARRDVETVVNAAKVTAAPTIKVADPRKLVLDNVKVTAPLNISGSYAFDVVTDVDLRNGASHVQALKDLHHRIEARRSDLLANTTLTITCGNVTTNGFEGRCLPKSVMVRLGQVAPPFTLTVTSNKGYLLAKAAAVARAMEEAARAKEEAIRRPSREATGQRNCKIVTDIEQRPFMENVCDYNNYGPVNCRNIATRYDEIRHERRICN